jgi:biotin carboxyl carrier protein
VRYFVTIDDHTIEVDVTGEGVRVNGQLLQAELTTVPGTPVRQLSVDGRSHAVHVTAVEGKGNWDFHLDGDRFVASAIDERAHAIRSMTGGAVKATGPKPVKAPMPGLIVKVLVELGQRVHPGDSVIIIEAMKMQNELKAETGGVVKKIAAEPGSPVEKGAILIEFEHAEARS